MPATKSRAGYHPYIDLLRAKADLSRAPFTDRGSRVLLFQERGQSRLFVHVARRTAGLEPGTKAFADRRPIVGDLTLTDEHDHPMEFETSAGPDSIGLNTRRGAFEITFQDVSTLAIGLPPTDVGLRCSVHPALLGSGAEKSPPPELSNFAGVSNGEFAKRDILPTGDGYTIDLRARPGDDRAITVRADPEGREPSKAVPFSHSLAGARDRWSKWFARVPAVSEELTRAYALAWWVLGSNLVEPRGDLLYECVMPSKSTYVGAWLWDSALHALALRHTDIDLARNQLRLMLAHQQPSGMLPDVVFEDGVITELDHPVPGPVTKPPITAWAAWQLHQSAPSIEFLGEIYPSLVRENGWWMEHSRDAGEELCHYLHPYSSGLDDSPLWDEGMPVVAPDLNTHLCLQMDALEAMARTLGLTQQARAWRRSSDRLGGRMAERLWDGSAGLFRALRKGAPIDCLTPFSLFPLWTGRLDSAIAARLIEHLLDPAEFAGSFTIPTVARNDPRYAPDTMWRGPVWANINYFFVDALTRSGRWDLAADLRKKTLGLIKDNPGMYEYYNAETGLPPSTAAINFGWTAAVFIELALQENAHASHP
jgi:putative isomerase